ncbi:MAG: hypothetical protein ACRDF6_04960, partial [bacterium]
MRILTSRPRAVLAAAALVVLAGAPFTETPTQAQPQNQIDPALYSGMRWRSIGPDRGGRSIAVAGSQSRPS